MTYLNKTWFICVAGVVINFLIAYGTLFYQEPIGPDSIIYLNAAKAFLSDGLKAAMAIYKWPFYSVLIAILSKLTYLSLENAAYLLNAISTSIVVVFFVLLIKELGGAITEQYFGLLVILLYPFLNHERQDILRDFGYYAFLLVSLLFFMRYLRVLNWRYAISWIVSITIATLFRIEGAMLLVFAPLLVFAKLELNFLQKLNAFLKVYSINIILGIFLLGLIVYKSQYLSQIGRILDLIIYAQHGWTIIIDNFVVKQIVVKNSVIPDSANSIPAFLLGGLTAVFLDKFIATMGLFYTALMGYAFAKKLIPGNVNTRLAMYGYASIVLITLLAFFMQQFFLTPRYIAALCLILMLSIPFTLSHIFSVKKRWLFSLVCFLLFVTAINSLYQFGPSKSYLVQAGRWVKQNTLPQDRLYSNSSQLAYYSDRPGRHYPEDYPEDFGMDSRGLLERLEKLNLTNYDYVALQISRHNALKEKQILAFFKQQPIAEFHNRHGDKVLIFKVQH